MAGEPLGGFSGLFLVLALSSVYLGQKAAALSLLLAWWGGPKAAGGSQQWAREVLPGHRPEPVPGMAANWKGTRGYFSAGDDFRVVPSPPEWVLTSSGKLLPLLASWHLDFLGELLPVPAAGRCEPAISSCTGRFKVYAEVRAHKDFFQRV